MSVEWGESRKRNFISLMRTAICLLSLRLAIILKLDWFCDANHGRYLRHEMVWMTIVDWHLENAPQPCGYENRRWMGIVAANVSDRFSWIINSISWMFCKSCIADISAGCSPNVNARSTDVSIVVMCMRHRTISNHHVMLWWVSSCKKAPGI